MSIEVNNESAIPVDEPTLLRLASYALDQMHVHPDAELAIVLVDEAAMEQLHVQWMDEPGPTDVLSFPMDELRPGTEDAPTPAGLLGDVVLCPQVAEGQAQTAGYDQAAFLNQVCPKVSALFNCNKLMVDVQNYTVFPSSPSLPIDSQRKLVNNFVYQPGVAGNIVLVRLMYEWPVYVPVIGYINVFSTNLANGNQLLMATAAFRNEPYGP